jgi:ElaA protein
MLFTLKTFSDLTVQELYEILRLRSEIFVVEQNCVFLDMDNKDQIALHLIGRLDQKIVAYTRLYDAGQYYA